MKSKIIKQDTSKARFRVFKNRFASYVLQRKEKAGNGEWKILNAFAEKKSALNYLEGQVRTELRSELKRHLATLN